MRKNVLVLGGGGREHALAEKLRFDSHVFCAPGNAGTFAQNVALDIMDNQAVVSFCLDRGIHLVVPGPEGPLVNGVVDVLRKAGILTFGPNAFASQLEGSKIFARKLMGEWNIPQPEYRVCSSLEDAENAIKYFGLPVFVKADGLCGGKGAIPCQTREEFDVAVKMMLIDKKFGEAGLQFTVEEWLEGEGELSVFAACDGTFFRIIGSAQDHKREGEGDTGRNTGGMGAYAPTPLSTPELLEMVGNQIIQPTLYAMEEKGHPFTGFLYCGLMIIDGSPYVIEFNVRMGDPEAQVVLPLLETSLFDLLYAGAKERIAEADFKLSGKNYVTVVLAAENYPDKPKTGMVIHGLDKLDPNDLVFHAGTKLGDNGEIIVSGGRVLNVVGCGHNLASAIEDAYRIAKKISFDGMWHRFDIGRRGLGYLKA